MPPVHGGLRRCTFFRSMVEKIHGNFPALFDQQEDEREDDGGKGGGNEVPASGFASGYGILPYLLTYCRVTNETLSEAYRGSVIHLFYIVSYETERLEADAERIRRQRRT